MEGRCREGRSREGTTTPAMALPPCLSMLPLPPPSLTHSQPRGVGGMRGSGCALQQRRRGARSACEPMKTTQLLNGPTPQEQGR